MAEAKLNKEYAVRISFVGAIMLALSVWSIYDGAVAWPNVNKGMDKVRVDLINGCRAGLPPEYWLSAKDSEAKTYRLQEKFSEYGLKVPKYLVQELQSLTTPQGDDSEARKARAKRAEELFEKPIYSQAKLNSQFIQAAVTLVLALLAFMAVASKRKTVYVVDENGLSGSGFGGKQIAWDEVASVDWSKWDEKGIIGISLKDGCNFKLDGWHFAGMRPIAEILNGHFPKSVA